MDYILIAKQILKRTKSKSKYKLFDVRVILVIEFILIEIKNNNHLDPETFGALSSIVGESYQFFDKEEEFIHKLLKVLKTQLYSSVNYQHIEDLQVPITNKNWISYFAKSYKRISNNSED